MSIRNNHLLSIVDQRDCCIIIEGWATSLFLAGTLLLEQYSEALSYGGFVLVWRNWITKQLRDPERAVCSSRKIVAKIHPSILSLSVM